LPAYEELARGGRDFGASLRLYYQKGAMAALVEDRQDVAIQRYLRARELGASNEELGFGVEVLHRAVVKAQTAADKAYDEQRFADCRAQLEKLLAIEPSDLAARDQVGVVCFKLKDYAAASAAWRSVLELAAKNQVKLPEPVHLNLARSLKAEGKTSAEIKPLLEEYLAKQPEGEWAAQTREMLDRLGP
jgi:tetratricopeptide (TPR) repeat protein